MDESEIQIIENELQRIQKGVFESWRIYMSWYTWFFGANLIVLGWIFTKEVKADLAAAITVFSAAWIIFNIMGIVSAIRLQSYTRVAAKEALHLTHRLAELAGSSKEQHKNLGFPLDLARVAGFANAAALLVVVVLWLYLLSTYARIG